MTEEIQILDLFFLTFPREIGWKCLLKSGQQVFVRNRYVKNAAMMHEKLEEIKNDFFASVYSFEGEYSYGKAWDRNKAIIDRVFFDFDCKEAPREAMKETKKLVRTLSAKPIVVFSGAKGFHVHILFRRTKAGFENVKEFGKKIIEKLKLRTCDPQVFDVARLCRVPLSHHSSTGNRCVVINAEKFLKMDFDDVLNFAKNSCDVPDYDLDDEVRDTIERLEMLRRVDREMEFEIPDILGVRGNRIIGNETVRRKRIEMYVETLRKYGCLSANPRIREIHLGSKWIAQNTTAGAIEHIARVYLVLLMIEEGFSDEEIHAVMRFAKDYNEKRTQYYIDYNRKWLERKKRGNAG
ncbi:MAG: hypothetical protein QXU01_03840 [Candidatus Hadarchaeales archaeon]